MSFIVSLVIVGFVIYLWKRNSNRPKPEKVVEGVAFDSLSDESRYGQFCSFLGSRESVLTEAMGMPDDTLTNEYGTRFLHYERFKALVTVNTDGVAIHVDAPCQDSFGHPFNGPWKFQGITVGDTRATVQEAWGPPFDQAEWGLDYGNKSWMTNKKRLCNVRLHFDDNGLSYLSSMIKP